MGAAVVSRSAREYRAQSGPRESSEGGEAAISAPVQVTLFQNDRLQMDNRSDERVGLRMFCPYLKSVRLVPSRPVAVKMYYRQPPLQETVPLQAPLILRIDTLMAKSV